MVPDPCPHRASPFCRRRRCRISRGLSVARRDLAASPVYALSFAPDAVLDREWRERVAREL